MKSPAVRYRSIEGDMTMKIARRFALGFAMLATLAGTAFASPTTSYVTTVHLRDGKQAVCAVNEPLGSAGGVAQGAVQTSGTQSLSKRERNEAEIDATAPLRRLPINQNHYPTPATAPTVNCS
jgi:hypothetical protein